MREALGLTGLTLVALEIHERYGIGLMVIAESHISVHVKADRAFVDCFSCRRFRWGAVVGAARRTFGGTWRSQYFQRSVPPTCGSWWSRVLRAYSPLNRRC